MPRLDIAVLIISPDVAEKIRTKHPPLTAEDVKAALLYGRNVTLGWEDHELYGRRLVAQATTYGRVEFIAYMRPLNENDPEEGTFDLRTAFPKPI